MIDPTIFIVVLVFLIGCGVVWARHSYPDEAVIELLPTPSEMVDWDALLKPMRDALNVFGLALEQLEPTMKQLGEIFSAANDDIVESFPMRQEWKDQSREAENEIWAELREGMPLGGFKFTSSYPGYEKDQPEE